ncbi:MAG: DUF4249 domain-containing protein [Reichenbachiella sp.]
MKNLIILIAIFLSIGVNISCDDQIYPELQDSDPFLVVDAWINDKPEPQIVSLISSVPYFDQEEPPGLTGAEVYVVGESNDTTRFSDIGEGKYEWIPTGSQGFGEVGINYTLHIDLDGQRYQASSLKRRTTLVDSVYFIFEETGGFEAETYYKGQFLAVDSIGAGDTYWIKAYKNDEYLGKPSEINVAYDAGFSEGGGIDGITFIPPIRDAVNPFDGEEDEFVPPFDDGDSLLVEIHSITTEALGFLNEVRIQTDRPGGFAELFASPLSNVPSNINCITDETIEVGGFFCVSSVQSNGARLDVSTVPIDQ